MKITRDSWIYAQQCVLGSCLIDQRAISEILFTLKETDFVDYYKPIFQTMVDLYTLGKPVDPAVIIHAIGDDTIDQVLRVYRQVLADVPVKLFHRHPSGMVIFSPSQRCSG